MTLDAADILGQFDASRDEFTFIDLNHGYYATIDARLHFYGDGERWALLGEVVGYNPRAANVVDVVHHYGNCLTSGPVGFENGDFFARVDNMDDVEDPEEPEGYLGGVPVRVRGVDLAVEAEDGDDLEDVFRLLVPEHRDLLLADEAELRRRIPADLPKIATIDEWHQPDLFEVVPSASPAYQLIAAVLATADAGLWAPTQEPNTHWSNWPESGQL